MSVSPADQRLNCVCVCVCAVLSTLYGFLMRFCKARICTHTFSSNNVNTVCYNTARLRSRGWYRLQVSTCPATKGGLRHCASMRSVNIENWLLTLTCISQSFSELLLRDRVWCVFVFVVHVCVCVC